MKRLIMLIFLCTAAISGCAQNHFNIPAENFAAKVRVIGVAPIMLDSDSDITHPDKGLLVPLLTELNRNYEPLLIRRLQSTGNFYAVTPLVDDAKQLFPSLVSRREKRDDAGVQYLKYFWKNEEIAAYIKKNRVDAVMLVVISGFTRNSRIFSSNLLSTLETDYNFLIMTAQIVAQDGTVLWEYPNFRGQLLTYYPLINLQYPDFSESDANLSSKTRVQFKSIDGIRRVLEKKRSDWILRETTEPEIYGKMFDEMVSLIKYPASKATGETAAEGKVTQPAEGGQHKSPPVAEKPLPLPAPSPAKTVPSAPAPTQVTPAPSAKTTSPAISPMPTAPTPPATIPLETQAPAPVEIVPATGSTL